MVGLQKINNRRIRSTQVAGSLASLSRSNAQNRREWPRYTAERSFALAARLEGRLLPCSVTDISLGGARLVFDDEVPAGADLDLSDAEGQTVACQRVWQDGKAVGVAFDFSEESLGLVSVCLRNMIDIEHHPGPRGV